MSRGSMWTPIPDIAISAEEGSPGRCGLCLDGAAKFPHRHCASRFCVISACLLLTTKCCLQCETSCFFGYLLFPFLSLRLCALSFSPLVQPVCSVRNRFRLSLALRPGRKVQKEKKDSRSGFRVFFGFCRDGKPSLRVKSRSLSMGGYRRCTIFTSRRAKEGNPESWRNVPTLSHPGKAGTRLHSRAALLHPPPFSRPPPLPPLLSHLPVSEMERREKKKKTIGNRVAPNGSFISDAQSVNTIAPWRVSRGHRVAQSKRVDRPPLSRRGRKAFPWTNLRMPLDRRTRRPTSHCSQPPAGPFFLRTTASGAKTLKRERDGKRAEEEEGWGGERRRR